MTELEINLVTLGPQRFPFTLLAGYLITEVPISHIRAVPACLHIYLQIESAAQLNA
jgi:hypothetical protein